MKQFIIQNFGWIWFCVSLVVFAITYLLLRLFGYKNKEILIPVVIVFGYLTIYLVVEMCAGFVITNNGDVVGFVGYYLLFACGAYAAYKLKSIIRSILIIFLFSIFFAAGEDSRPAIVYFLIHFAIGLILVNITSFIFINLKKVILNFRQEKNKGIFENSYSNISSVSPLISGSIVSSLGLAGGVNIIIGLYNMFDSILLAIIGAVVGAAPWLWFAQSIWYAVLEFVKYGHLTINGYIAIVIWLAYIIDAIIIRKKLM